MKRKKYNYSVNYGVNNSHLTECCIFDKYGEAMVFYNQVNSPFNVKILFKMTWRKGDDSSSIAGYMLMHSEVKTYKLDPGTCERTFFDALSISGIT